MFDRIVKNWKTTVAGIVAGVGNYLVNQGSQGFTWESFAPALVALLVGVFAKDK